MSLEGKSQDEISALAALADDVLSKPETAGVFKRLVKRNNPNVSMPEVEMEDRARAEFAKRDKVIDELRGNVAQSAAEKSANVLYENLRDAGSVTTRASFNELVKWASENGFMTSETGLRKAAQQRAYEQESAEPTPQSFGTASLLPSGADAKDWMKDPKGMANRIAIDAMNELAKNRKKVTQH